MSLMSCNSASESQVRAVAEPGEELSGGDTTVFQDGLNAFALPLANISRQNKRSHVVGDSFFNKNWVIAPASTKARDGLGPLFNARSCSSCHTLDGRAAPPASGELMTGLLFRLSIPANDSAQQILWGPEPDPMFGGQLAVRAIPGVEPEGNVEITYEEVPGTYPDGTAYSLRKPHYKFLPNPTYGDPHPEIMLGPRIAQAVHGGGLLEAIPESKLYAWADPEDNNRDGISGRVNLVWNPEKQKTEVGRFGWKSNKPDLRQQAAGAFLGDIGITSEILPEEATTELQNKRNDFKALYPSESPEINDKLLTKVEIYLQTLAPPARRNWKDPEVLRGKLLFHQVNCTGCHIPYVKTGPHVLEELSHQEIRPFTDLLLHDMGPGLADGRPDFKASGSEWRTAPLWGIGMVEVVNGHTFFLHDGRARNIEEAILWHGGEAEKAKEDFKNLSKEDREALIRFVNSL